MKWEKHACVGEAEFIYTHSSSCCLMHEKWGGSWVYFVLRFQSLESIHECLNLIDNSISLPSY